MTLYGLRYYIDYIKTTKNQVQVALQPPSASRTEVEESENIRQVQYNNNHSNPEILQTRFFFFVFIVLLIGVVPTFFVCLSSETDFVKFYKRMVELRFPQSLFFIFACAYPYFMNESLQKFVLDYFKWNKIKP